MEINKEQLCNKIQKNYPDIGSCGIGVDTQWDEDTGSWVVDLKKEGKELTTHLEASDAEKCMDGHECVHLTMQIVQLKSNI